MPVAPVNKSQFLNALTCTLMARFDREPSESLPSPADKWQWYQGNQLQKLARAELGPGTLLPTSPRETAIEFSLKSLNEKPAGWLFEVTFAYEDFIARADAMRWTSNGWELIEIKSSKLPNGDDSPKSKHVDDAAYTLAVASLAGVPVSTVQLMMLNREYTLGSNEMFGAVDVTDDVRARATEFMAVMPQIAHTVLADDHAPGALEFHCKKCDYFKTRCVGRDIDDHIFRIPLIKGKKFEAIKHLERIRNLPTGVDLTDRQANVVHVIKSGEVAKNPAILRELDTIVWPALYLDFEAVMPALPWFEGDVPYANTINQFSIHKCSAVGVVDNHFEYLAPQSGDFRRDMAEKLLQALEGDGSIFVYSSYESQRLKDLAKLFPDMNDAIERILARLFDLERMFKSGYVHPGFAGHSSIKKVLPVLVPSRNYDTMAIGNGLDAAGIFSLMWVGELFEHEFEARRRELLDYCKLDTLAMVELHAALVSAR